MTPGPQTVVAPGPRLTGPAGWNKRHREFHVKPGSALAPSGSTLEGRGRLLVYRVQLALVFRSTPRSTPADAILQRVAECRLAIELIDMAGLVVSWEGPRWHIRYAEGAAFDGSCALSAGRPLDEVRDGDSAAVAYAGGSAELGWTAAAEFAAFVNRYVALGPELLILAGWPLGPALGRGANGPELETSGAPSVHGAVWATHATLGRVECGIEGDA